VKLSAGVLDRVRVLHSRDDDPAGLAARLWDLPEWVRRGRELLDEMANGYRHSRPVRGGGGHRPPPAHPTRCCPPSWLPEDWPGDTLRNAYTDFAAELVARRDGVELMETT